MPTGPGSPMRRNRRVGTVAWCTLAALLSLTASAVAAPPANDNFADAAEMTGWPAEATGSSVDATSEPDEPIGGDHSIWFKWTAPRDGGITLRTDGCAQPFQDSDQRALTWAVYRRSAIFGLVNVELSFHAEAGQVYWIAVASERGQTGDPDICVRLVPGPANDDFAQATPLGGFPASVTRRLRSNEGGVTREPGEPNHGGYDPPGGSLWYSWRAPADGPVMLRICGEGTVAVYTGDHVGGLTHVSTRRARQDRCGNDYGARIVVNAIEGEVYRIAVVGTSEWFRLSVGSQAEVATRAGKPFFSYTAFPGRTDRLELRLAGSGARRALLVEARGVTAANGCQADAAAGHLRCPVPGKAPVGLDVDLGGGNDTADLRRLGRVRPSNENVPRQVRGGDGDDVLAGSGLTLDGGPGADRLTGGPGGEGIYGGPGPDRIVAGAGGDNVDGGQGNDWIVAGSDSDVIYAGRGDDRVRTLDDASDIIFCAAGRDRARLDGIDVPRGCERRNLSSPARAVSIGAILSNDDGEDEDHLEIGIACPIDVKGGCRTRVAVAGTRSRIITRRLRLPAGRFAVVSVYRLGAVHWSHGSVRVTVSTQRRGRATLKFTQRLPVSDERYYGEG
jgi:RTX calcium-binding nonapeptide repeat (4 copies)